ncbi:aminotransferase class V-fold PLP-dependent enzyme [Moraxella nasovis]|uniref:aminotransferase class V-fold PLP-dependent enzyme n=1 Tax=Moraxella nasovis TaxID=2904121 RepID=UPI001F61E6AA|nr:aminotransferase class V-fold PLP-dependent enzyme [Moraxella nasovis]UNU73804.1 aminotransferase class V-fold PLP-dependent enzyme [Moraxella nasovis]
MFTSNQLNHIRAQFDALQRLDDAGQKPLYFDGPGGSQLPNTVIDAISDYLRLGNSNMGGHNHAGQNTTQINRTARQQAATWLGADSDSIVFGLNSTSLMFNVSRAIAQTWQAGENIVVCSLNHFSHVSSWERAAHDKGVEVRTIALNADKNDLDYNMLDTLIDEKTRLVAVTLASNVIGTIVDVKRIIDKAKSVNALVSVDAVHAIVHLPVNAAQMGADFIFASAYKIGGPHLGMMYAKHEHLQHLNPYKVEPATNIAPMSWEQGTQSFEAQAGFIAMMNYWANLAFDTPSTALTQDNKSLAYQNVVAHELTLNKRILEHFARRPHLKLYGKTTANDRTPTFAFNLVKDGKIQNGAALSEYLGTRNIALGCGNFYAKTLVESLSPTAAVLRLGCLHYNTVDEIDELFEIMDLAINQLP